MAGVVEILEAVDYRAEDGAFPRVYRWVIDGEGSADEGGWGMKGESRVGRRLTGGIEHSWENKDRDLPG